MAFTETNCCIEHEGRTFCAAGASQHEGRLAAYMGKNGAVTDWHGNRIGRYVVASSWKAPLHWWVTDRVYALHIRLDADGKLYKGRGYGEGIYLSAKRAKNPGLI